MKMKKFLVIGLAVALSACLVGCKDDEVAQNPNNDSTNNGGNQQTTVAGTATGDVSGDIITMMTKGNVMVNAPYQDYITAEMAEAYVGLTQAEYEENIESGVFYESMMSPANQSNCLLKVKEGADVASLQQIVFEKANPRKCICMSANRVLVMADDSYIMLAMGTQEACDALKVEFTEIAGSDMRESLDKTVSDSEIPADADLPGMGDMEIPMDGDIPAASPEAPVENVDEVPEVSGGEVPEV